MTPAIVALALCAIALGCIFLHWPTRISRYFKARKAARLYRESLEHICCPHCSAGKR